MHKASLRLLSVLILAFLLPAVVVVANYSRHGDHENYLVKWNGRHQLNDSIQSQVATGEACC